MVLGNTPIVVQNMLGKTPKSFNAVDVVSGAFVHQMFFVLDRMMLAQPFKGIVTAELVRKVHRSFSRFLSDDGHEFLGRDPFYDTRIDRAIALQKPKYNAFAPGTPSALALSPAAKVTFVKLNLARQLAALKFGHVIDRFTQTLIHARDGLVVEAKIMRETVGRLLLVETLHDGYLGAYALQGLLFPTDPIATPHISARRFRYFERTAENTLFSSQKVGRAPENVLLSCNHKGILTPCGYETH